MFKITAKSESSILSHIWHFFICNFACNYGKIVMLILI